MAVKSYSLSEAMDHFARAVGPTTAILAILNGMARLDSLSTRFGTGHIVRGVAMLSAAMDNEGRVTRIFGNDLVFGEIAGGLSDRSRALDADPRPRAYPCHGIRRRTRAGSRGHVIARPRNV